MNELIDTMFGDRYITLQCDSGECLHYSQVPGYEVSNTQYCCVCTLIMCLQPPPKPDNSQFIALSVAGAGFFVVLATAGKLT